MRHLPNWLMDSEEDGEYGAAPPNRGRSIVYKPCQDVVKNFKWSRLDAEATRIIREARQVARGETAVTIKAKREELEERKANTPSRPWKFRSDDRESELLALGLEFARAIDRKHARHTWSESVNEAIYGALRDISAQRLSIAGRGRQSGKQIVRGHKILHQLAGSVPQARRREINKKYRQLTDDQAREIRFSYRAGGTSYNKLAAQYGVKAGTISMVINGSAYADAGGPLYWPEIGFIESADRGRTILLAKMAKDCAA